VAPGRWPGADAFKQSLCDDAYSAPWPS